MTATAPIIYTPLGALDEFFYRVRDPEILVEGAAGTGKTYCILQLLHAIAYRYPNVRLLVLRKTLKSLTSTTAVTYRERVLAPGELGSTVEWYGGSGSEPAHYRYKNGSTIEFGGMDKSDKILGSFYDLIYCFTGDTLIESPSVVKEGYSRTYSGPLVTIRTALGHKLTGTPNHPILTDKGWIKLGLLSEGDYVVSGSLSQKEAVRDPNVNNKPTAIAEIVDSLALAGVSSQRVMSKAMDFHGDGGNGYVDVITPTSFFHDADVASVGQHELHLDIGGRDFDLLPFKSDGSAPQILLTSMRSSDRNSSFSMERLAPSIIAGKSSFGSLALAEGTHTAPFEFSLNSTIANSEHSTRLVEAADSGEIVLDCIIDISRVEQPSGGSCQVYNLRTKEHYYFANGIIAHNCNEAVELSLQQWQRLTTRLRDGPLPEKRIIGDCNPSFAHHWLNKRCLDGLTRRVMTTHADNPTVTPEYLATLEKLSGSQRERFLLGQWAGIENAVYPTLDPSIHLQPLPDDVRWGTGAIGVDYGEVHFSAVVAVQRASDGIYWARRCWAEAGGNPQLIEDATRGMKVQYNINRVRTDPLQKVLAYRLGGKTAEYNREQRIAYTRRLLESGNLMFDIDGEGIRDLFDEMLGYRYEFKETDTMAKNQLVRKQDDRVAALEDAIEELEIEGGGVSWSLPTPQVGRDPVTYRPYVSERQPPLVRAFRSF